MEKNSRVELEIESLSGDGNGVGHVDGKVVFVPATAAGDRVVIRIVQTRKTYAYGRVEEILRPSPDRMDIDCPAYPQCGGCDFRHLRYEAELASKRQFVADALQRLGGISCPIQPILYTGQCDRYRNKAQFPVAEGPAGLTYGLYASRSHRVIATTSCRLQPEAVNRVASFCCLELTRLGITAYNEQTQKGLLRHLLLRQSSVGGRLLLCLVLTKDRFPGESAFAQAVTAAFPEIHGIVLNTNPDNTNVILGRQFRTLWGAGYLEDELAGVPVRLSAPSFFQVNKPAAELLYRQIADFAAPTADDTILDLYCGTGTIGLSLASACRRVIGVEVVPPAVEDARANARAIGAQNAEFILDSAAGAAERLAQAGKAIDIAITDPPRKGCDSITLRALVSMAPRRIVMVSCNAATLARDAAFLVSAGYEARCAVPVDMFPRTRHIEVVMLMTKK